MKNVVLFILLLTANFFYALFMYNLVYLNKIGF